MGGHCFSSCLFAMPQIWDQQKCCPQLRAGKHLLLLWGMIAVIPERLEIREGITMVVDGEGSALGWGALKREQRGGRIPFLVSSSSDSKHRAKGRWRLWKSVLIGKKRCSSLTAKGEMAKELHEARWEEQSSSKQVGALQVTHLPQASCSCESES